MFVRTAVCAAVVLVPLLSAMFVSSVQAQDASAVPLLPVPQESVAFLAAAAAAAAEPQLVPFPRPVTLEMPKKGGRSAALLGLCASTIALQALDISSTMSALRRGAVEANRLMRGVTSNNAAFYTTKIAMSATTIFVANRIARRNRRAALLFLTAVDVAFCAIVIHNYRVAGGQR